MPVGDLSKDTTVNIEDLNLYLQNPNNYNTADLDYIIDNWNQLSEYYKLFDITPENDYNIYPYFVFNKNCEYFAVYYSSTLYSNYSVVYQFVNNSYIQIGNNMDSRFVTGISNDGNTIRTYSGRNIYIYTLIDNIWTQLGNNIYVNSNGFPGHMSRYAWTLLSGDGNVVAGNDYAGVCRLWYFNNANSTWTSKGSITSGSYAAVCHIDNSGNNIIISNPLDGSSGYENGQLKFYTWNGSSWTQLGVDISYNSDNDEFGNEVSINGSGTRIIATSSLSDSNGGQSGHAWFYDWNGTSWIQAGNIYGESADNRLGSSVAMSNSGQRISVGCIGDGYNATGEVKVFNVNTVCNTPLSVTISTNSPNNVKPFASAAISASCKFSASILGPAYFLH